MRDVGAIARESDVQPRPMVRAGRQHVLSSKLWAILWLLSFVLLAALLFNQGWSAPSLNQIGGGPDDADARLATWFLAWAPHALGHGLNPLFSASVDYPQGINLMWNTSMVFPALVLTPITAAFGPVVSYNALTTLALSLSAWCAYLAAWSRMNGWSTAMVAPAIRFACLMLWRCLVMRWLPMGGWTAPRKYSSS